MSNKVDITIGKAGVIGCAVARDLSYSGRKSAAGWWGGGIGQKNLFTC